MNAISTAVVALLGLLVALVVLVVAVLAVGGQTAFAALVSAGRLLRRTG